jgi:DNA polymerase-3 subunit alpha
MSKIPALREKVLKTAKSEELGKYVWKFGIGPQMGYSFSLIHALAYSFIGVQGIYLAINWNPIFWNTACLRVNSGSIVEDGTTNYEKNAIAINNMMQSGINISLIDINKSGFSFEPDLETNSILYGMQALSSVSPEIIDIIKQNRPYKSIKDFLSRVTLKKPAMISLIKSGAFDNYDAEWAAALGIETRKATMLYYLMSVGDFKKKINLQNFPQLIKENLVPPELDFQKKTFLFNKELKKYKIGEYYVLTNNYLEIYTQIFDQEQRTIEIINNTTCISEKKWKKIYDKVMDSARDYFIANQDKLLSDLNIIILQELWDKYGQGSASAWEMESLGFYYHEHELAHLKTQKYGIINFNNLSPDSKIAIMKKFKNREIPIYEIYTIAGTVIAKNDQRSTISLLTTTGVVTVKFTKEYYAMYKRQISDFNEKGEKKIMERSWFKKGTKLVISGYRRDDMFISKTYTSTNKHQLYKITNVTPSGEIEITHDRYNGGFEEDEAV